MSGRERQKKEVHIKRGSHTHANKAKSLQRCRDPKNEHREIQRDRQKKRDTRIGINIQTHSHRNTDILHLQREREEEEIQILRETHRHAG